MSQLDLYIYYIYHGECGVSMTRRKLLRMLGNTASGSPMPRVYSKIRLRCLWKIRMLSASAGTLQSA